MYSDVCFASLSCCIVKCLNYNIMAPRRSTRLRIRRRINRSGDPVYTVKTGQDEKSPHVAIPRTDSQRAEGHEQGDPVLAEERGADRERDLSIERERSRIRSVRRHRSVSRERERSRVVSRRQSVSPRRRHRERSLDGSVRRFDSVSAHQSRSRQDNRGSRQRHPSRGNYRSGERRRSGQRDSCKPRAHRSRERRERSKRGSREPRARSPRFPSRSISNRCEENPFRRRIQSQRRSQSGGRRTEIEEKESVQLNTQRNM